MMMVFMCALMLKTLAILRFCTAINVTVPRTVRNSVGSTYTHEHKRGAIEFSLYTHGHKAYVRKTQLSINQNNGRVQETCDQSTRKIDDIKTIDSQR
jgi:hypothetical protein